MPRINLTTSSVVAAAAELVDELGYDALTLSAVAKKLGVQTPSLYSHVRDRAALLDGVRDVAVSALTEQISAAIAGRSSKDAIRGLADAQRDFARERPGQWVAILRPVNPDAARSEPAVRLRQSGFAVLRAYDLPEAELQYAAQMLDSTINGFVELERAKMLRHFESDPDPEASWQRIIFALDAIFQAWPTVVTATEKN